MIAQYGSGEGWQRAMAFDWMARLGALHRTGRNMLFEGQLRLSFLAQAAAAAGSTNHVLVLVDCDDATRTRRLIVDREQPDLANPTMMGWAAYLCAEAERMRRVVLNTTVTPLEVCVARVWAMLGE